MFLPIVRLAYSLLFVLALPIIFCRLIYKGRRLPAYRRRWAERLGFVSFIANKDKALKPIWVHAASVGEIIAAVPLIKLLSSQYVDRPILITTMTPTGSEQVQIRFKNELNNTIFHCYVPYDIGFIVRRFLNRLSPIALIILETELWPNLISISHEKKIPTIIVNARLSPHSVQQYRFIKWIMRPLLNQLSFVAAQSKIDVERYLSLGLDSKKILNMGNLKYDLNIPEGTLEKGVALRKVWDKAGSAPRWVWIAASTHSGEESIVLSVFLKLQKKYPSLLLLLVPRHPNRFEEVYQLCLKHTPRVIRKTQLKNDIYPDIFLGDTMGDLWEYYAASDGVFLGGSLVPIGGHNLLEPAALGLPIVTGPHLFTILEMRDCFMKVNGLKIIQDAQGLEAVIEGFISQPALAKAQGLAVGQIIEQNRGASYRILELIKASIRA